MFCFSFKGAKHISFPFQCSNFAGQLTVGFPWWSSGIKKRWSLGRARLFATAWTVAHQARLSMGFCRQAYWSGWPCPFPGDLPDLRMAATSLLSAALASGFFTTSTAWQALTRMLFAFFTPIVSLVYKKFF